MAPSSKGGQRTFTKGGAKVGFGPGAAFNAKAATEI